MRSNQGDTIPRKVTLANNEKIQIPFNKRKGSEVESKNKYTFTKGNQVTFKIRVQANSTKKFKVYYRTKKG